MNTVYDDIVEISETAIDFSENRQDFMQPANVWSRRGIKLLGYPFAGSLISLGLADFGVIPVLSVAAASLISPVFTLKSKKHYYKKDAKEFTDHYVVFNARNRAAHNDEPGFDDLLRAMASSEGESFEECLEKGFEDVLGDNRTAVDSDKLNTFIDNLTEQLRTGKKITEENVAEMTQQYFPMP